MYIADTLSRAYIHDNLSDGTPPDMEIMVHSFTSSLPISGSQLSEIKIATSEDETLNKLKRIVKQGWPNTIKTLSPDLRSYWNIRDEIHEADDCLFKRDRIIVPQSKIAEMLQLLHEGHLGTEKTKARACQILYWPNMANDIDDTISSCRVCLTHRPVQQKETLMPHDVPDRPGQKIAADIMYFKNKDYLVVIDYYSKYLEIALIQNNNVDNG
jgi:hypothetical protein